MINIYHKLRKLYVNQESFRHEIVLGGVGSILIKSASVLLQFILTIFLARLLGTTGYGLYTFVLTIVSLLALPAQLGLSALVLRETAILHVQKKWQLLKGLWRWSLIVSLIMSLSIMSLGIIFILFFDINFTIDKTITLLFGMLLLPIMVLEPLRSSAVRGLGFVIKSQIPDQILKHVVLIAFVVAGLMAFNKELFIASNVMIITVVSFAIAFIYGIKDLIQCRPKELSHSNDAKYVRKAWLMAALPMAVTQSANVINNYTDLLMLGVMHSDDLVGIYKISIQFSMLVVFGLQAINMVLAPHIARIYARRDMEKLQDIVTIGSRVISLLAIIALGVILLLGETLIHIIFGSEYAQSYFPLIILAIGQLINALVGSVGYILNMTGNQNDVAKGVVIAAVINVIFNAMLIPDYGIVGAAIATSLSLIIWNVFLWHRVWVRLKINSMAFSLFK